MKPLAPASRPRRRLGKVFVALFAAALVFGVAPASAMAAQSSASAEMSVASSVQASVASSVKTFDPDSRPTPPPGSGTGYATSSSVFIPINRWSAATAMLHYRTEAINPVELAATSVRVATQASALSWISTIWSGTAALTTVASNLEPVNAVGLQIDRATASMGHVVLGNPVLFILAAMFAVLAAVWNKSRGRAGGSMIKRALSVVLIIVAVGAMTAGADKSTPAAGSSGTYVPGLLSPGWIVTSISGTVSTVAGGLLNGMNGISDFTLSTNEDASTGQLSCNGYMKAMAADYGTFVVPSKGATVKGISTMWELVGLRTWATAQFGANNAYIDKVWCHQADANIAMARTTQGNYSMYGVTGADKMGTQLKSKAWRTDDQADADKTMIAWAACQWDGSDWYVEPAFTKKTGNDSGDWIGKEDCRKWWTDAKGDANLDDLHFNIGIGEAGSQSIDDLTDDEHVKDFVRSWQGTDIGFGSTTIIVWAIIASLILFLILGVGLSGMVAVAKILSVVTMMTLILVLLGSLFTKDGPGARVSKLLKQMVGYAFLAAGSSALFLLVTWFTQLMISLGTAFFEPGTTLALIWTAAAPIIGVISIGMIFKKFKLPNPLTPKGALAWGAGAGVAGGAVGAGLMGKLGGQAKSAVGGAVSNKVSGGLNRVSGGRLGSANGGGGGGGVGGRAGAGAPPELSKSRQRAATGAEREERRDAIAHVRAQSDGIGSIPMNAGDRTMAAGRVSARLTREGSGHLVDGVRERAFQLSDSLSGEAPGAAKLRHTVAGEEKVAAKAKKIEVAGQRRQEWDQAHAAQKMQKDAALALTPKGQKVLRRRENIAAVRSEMLASPLGQAGLRTKARVDTALAQKAADFKAHPVASSWQATKTATKYSALGLGGVVTGGLVPAVYVANKSLRGIKAGNQTRQIARTAAVDDAVVQYRKHQESQIDIPLPSEPAPAPASEPGQK